MEKIRGKLSKTVDVGNLLENKIIQAILNILMGISVASLTLTLLDNKGYELFNIILPILSFAITEFTLFKYKLIRDLYKNGIGKTRLIISSLLAFFTAYVFYNNMLVFPNNVVIKTILSFLSIPAIIVSLYWFYGKLLYYLKKYIKTMDKVEKTFLIIAGVILIIGISIINAKTSLFNYGVLKEEYYDYEINDTDSTIEDNSTMREIIVYKIKQQYLHENFDIIYTTDSPILLNFDVFSNVQALENDIRNPLFGVFSIPFAIIPKAISLIVPMNNIYALLLSIVHGGLIFIGFTLLARLMKLKGILKVLFLVIVSISFPTLLFLTSIEQYAISVFYLIVFIYMAVNKIKDRDIAYIMATGSITTSGILFPLLLEKGNIKQGIKNIFFTFLKCMAIFIISARIVLFLPNQSSDLMNYCDIVQVQNFNKYTNFAQNVLVGSEFREEWSPTSTKIWKTREGKISWQMKRPAIRAENTDKINIVGIIIIVLTVLGFVLNRKDRFMQICFAWVIFSILLLGVMGWGAAEDGLILYTFYFAWAFICLMFKGIERMLSKVPKIRNSVYSLAIATIIVVNVNIMVQIVQFGIKYYS